MKYRNLILSACVAAMAWPSFADDVPALTINQQGEECQVMLSNILNIKFSGSDMLLNMKDGTQLSFPMSEVITMTFGQMDTAIRQIVADQGGDGTYTLTDLEGKVIASGNIQSDGQIALPTQRGIYVLTVGNQSKKILVK